MKEFNYGKPVERKERPKNDKGEELIKNQECVSCKRMYECKGKPRYVTACVNFEERTLN